jgi:CheY-like chemotaxis protein
MKRLLEGALQSTDRAKALVNRLLGFARRQTLETRPVNVAELLEGMRDLITSSIGSTVELKMLAPADLPPALTDPNQLELAVLNLCVNSRDAMPDGGRLTIVAERVAVGPRGLPQLKPGAYVRLSVIDTGLGMDSTTLSKAVEPFFSTKGLGKGTGLGLSMVHGFAAQLGGAFALTSETGEGTRGDLYLPIAEAAAEPGVRLAAQSVQVSRRLTLLLVDDEDLVRAGTAEMLRELGHTVHEASGGAEALGKLNSGLKVDAVVTDYMMPRMNGAELAMQVRELDSDARILVITGYAGGDLDLGLPQLAKPFRQADIAVALDRLANSKSNVVPLRRA